MLKWVLIAIGSIVSFIAIFVCAVWFLFARDGDDVSALTERQSAQVLELKDAGSSYIVVYSYDSGHETFYGKMSIYTKVLHVGDTFGICVDPSDMSRHADTNPDCPPEGPGGVKDGVSEKPEL